MPISPAARTVARSASTPRRWPSVRGSPRAAAQRPLPSMMMATWRGTSKAASATAAGTSALGIGKPGACALLLKGEDFFFFRGQHVFDLGDRLIGGLLHLLGLMVVIVL